jgi:signal transduction histidine kinase
LRDAGEVKRFEAEYYRRDGKAIWGSLNARAIYNDDGEFVFVEGILEDITDRKKAERDLADLNRHLEQLVRERTEDLVNKARELEEANQRLRELDEMKSAFLSSVSHELRTPLTSILGFAKLLNKEFSKNFQPLVNGDQRLTRKGERIQENLAIISHEGERLTRLINDVLDLNKIESGSMGWRDEHLDMNEVIEVAASSVSGMFAQTSLKLISEIASNLPPIVADRDRMQQVLINLLNNASKFTEQGSVTLRAFSRFGQLRVEVVDTGTGIHSEDQSQIFEKFHQTQTDDTMVNKPKGTGLGLTICREIIEHYGGRIWVESEVGVGSTFIFTLPVAH